MIAYNKTALLNAQLLKKAKQWFQQKLLSDAQMVKIMHLYPYNLYTPSIFIKIGLFIFACFCISSSFGLLTLFLVDRFNSSDNTFRSIGIICLIHSILCVVVLEVSIKNRNLYKSGVDQALLYAAIGMLAAFFFACFNLSFNTQTALWFALYLLPLLLAATIRYAEGLVTICLAICSYAIYFLLLLKLGAISKLIMPFAFMLLSVGFYWLTKRLQQNEALFYWLPSLAVFECVALAVLYASSNYYVIRESSIAFFDMQLAKGQDVPFAIIFYLFTAIVPLAYVLYGLKLKDRQLLWLGLVLTAASAITFKYYFSLGHPEIVLSVAGVLLLLIAFAAMHYLKTPKHGISIAESTDAESFLNAEALLIAQSFTQITYSPQTNHTTSFGGGSSGGGGASDTW